MSKSESTPTPEQIGIHLINSTNKLRESGAELYLKEHFAMTQGVLDDTMDDEYTDKEFSQQTMDEFYFGNQPLAVTRHELSSGNGSFLSLCRVNHEGIATEEQVDVVRIDENGVVDFHFDFLSRGNRDLVDAVLMLDQAQTEMGWQPLVPEELR